MCIFLVSVLTIYFGNVPTHFPRETYFLTTYSLYKIFLQRLLSMTFCSFCRSVIFTTKCCPVSKITITLAHKRLFQWISVDSRIVKAAKETSKFQNWLLLTNSRRRYLTEILPIRRKTLSNQSMSLTLYFIRCKNHQVKHL